MIRSAMASVFLFVCVLTGAAFAHDEPQAVKRGTISGQIMSKSGGPMAGGTVFFFNDASGPPPSSSRYWRVPDEAFEVDNNGRFTAELSEGKYYLGAIRKLTGEPIGPPQEGDLFFISQDKTGKPKQHVLKKGETMDIGIVAEAAPFSRATLAKEGITSVEGAILDAEDKPVEGVLVFAFMTQNMVGRPLFISDKTGRDGRYLLRVYEGGKYYLRVRSNYGGGPPAEGEIMGVYRDNEPVVVKTGESKKGVNIKASKFPGRGPKKE